jgi:hypothetical protein
MENDDSVCVGESITSPDECAWSRTGLLSGERGGVSREISTDFRETLSVS